MDYFIVSNEETANITVVHDGRMLVADNSNPDFDEIVQKAIVGDESVVELFDKSRRAAAVLENLSDRVSVANSRLYIDQTEIEDAYADEVVRLLDEGSEDYKPLVNFLEKVYSNTSAGIRENLSRWLRAEEFTILPNGNIYGYRGLNSDFTSKHAGPGIVNGVRVNGHLDNSVGNIVEIDAALVEENPRVGCASGLHVGTYAYAKDWAGGGVVVGVEVDPRHVRSVPYECANSKMRVSKYVVREVVESKVDDSVYYADYDDDFDEYGEYDEGDYYE